MANDKGMRSSDAEIEGAGNKEKKDPSLKYQKIKSIFAKRMLTIQEESRKQNKPLTAEEALQRTIEFFNTQGDSNVITLLQEMLREKEKGVQDLTYDDIKEFAVSPYKTLNEVYTKRFYEQMNGANTFGMITLYVDQLGTTLQQSHIGTASGRVTFLKKKKFPPSNVKDIVLGINYFALLQKLLDEYLQQSAGDNPKKIEDFQMKFKSLKITNATILSHFKDKGIYDESFEAEQLILSGKKGVVVGTKGMDQKIHGGLDNLLKGLLMTELEESVSPAMEMLRTMERDEKLVTSFMRQEGYVRNLLKNYPRGTFVKEHTGAKKLYKEYVENNPEGLREEVMENVQKELQSLYLQRIEGQLREKNTEDTKYMLLLVQRLQGSREHIRLDDTTKQRLFKNYYAAFSEKFKTEAVQGILEGMGISEANIKSIDAFRQSFFDINKKDHVLRIEKDGIVKEIKLVLQKDVLLNDNATSFEDLLDFSFQIDLENSDEVFEGVVFEEFVGSKKVRSLDSEEKSFYPKKGEQYNFVYTSPGGEVQNGVGYVFIDFEEVEDEMEGKTKKKYIRKIYLLSENPYGEEHDDTGIELGDKRILRVFDDSKDFYTNTRFSPSNGSSPYRVKVDLSPDGDIASKFFGRLGSAVLGSAQDSEGVPGEGRVPLDSKFEPTGTRQDVIVEHRADTGSMQSVDGEDIPLEASDAQSAALNHEFSTYRFLDEQYIPEQLKNTLFSQDQTIYAWIDKGKVFFNKTYFEKRYKVTISESPEEDIAFMIDGKSLRDRLKGVRKNTTTEEYTRRRAFLAELRKWKLHETAHRVFHFNGVKDEQIAVKPIGSDTPSMLTQETLCRIADGSFDQGIISQEGLEKHGLSVVPQDTLGKKYLLITLENGQKELFLLEDIEAKIQEYIPGFTFSRLKRFDLDLLEKYETEPSRFFDLLATARAAAEFEDAARANKVVLNPEEITNPRDLIEELSKIERGTYYPEANGTVESSAEIELGGVRYRFKRKVNAIPRNPTPGGKREPLWIQKMLPLSNNQVVRDRIDEKEFIGDWKKAARGERIIDPKQIEKIEQQQVPSDKPQVPENDKNRSASHESDATDQEQPGESTSEAEKARNKFNSEFDKLDGSGEMRDGTILFFQDADSDIPGYGNTWIKARIINTTPESETFSIELLENSEKNFSQYAGTILTHKKSDALLEKLKQLGRGKVIKMNPTPTKSDRIDYVRDTTCTLPENRRGGRVTKNFEKRYMKDNKEAVGTITHVGKLMQSFAGEQVQEPLYEVTWGPSTVTLKGNVNDTTYWEHTMSYESFTQFLNTKGLDPLTAEEVKHHKDKTEPEKPKEKPFSIWDMFKSFNTISQALKKFPEAFKYKREQDQKMQAGFLYAGIANAIPGGLDFGLLQRDDVKNDAVSEVDSTVRQVIQEYKDRLSRSEGGKVHAGKVVQLIVKEVFENHSNRMRFRLKAAGYLLYVLENGGPYIRSLRSYSDKGIRVKAILGEEHQKKMLNERQKLIDEYKSKGSSDDVLQDRISKYELYYIKEKCTDHPFYGTKFGRAVEEQMNDMYQAGQINNVKEGEVAKGNIFEAYQTLKAGITNNIPKLVLGGLEAMEEMVEDKSHYLLFYKAVMMILISGIGHTFTKKYIDQFKNLMRRRGLPIGHFIGDAMHDHKVLTVIDYIATQGDKNDRLPSLRSAIQNVIPGRDPKKTNAINYSERVGPDARKQQVIMKVIEGWRTNNGFKVVDGLNYKNKRFLNNMVDTIPDGSEQKQILEQYKSGGIFNSYKDFREGSLGDGDSPFYAEGIFNIAPGTFESLMLDYNQDSGRFRYPQAKDMRNVFSATIDSFGTILTTTQDKGDKAEFVNFLLEKFEFYFKNKFKSGNRDKFVEAVKAKGEVQTALDLVRADVLRDAALDAEVQRKRREDERKKRDEEKKNREAEARKRRGEQPEKEEERKAEEEVENKEEVISSSKGFDPTAVSALRNYINLMTTTYTDLRSS